jgi:hypothetical protein
MGDKLRTEEGAEEGKCFGFDFSPEWLGGDVTFSETRLPNCFSL